MNTPKALLALLLIAGCATPVAKEEIEDRDYAICPAYPEPAEPEETM